MASEGKQSSSTAIIVVVIVIILALIAFVVVAVKKRQDTRSTHTQASYQYGRPVAGTELGAAPRVAMITNSMYSSAHHIASDSQPNQVYATVSTSPRSMSAEYAHLSDSTGADGSQALYVHLSQSSSETATPMHDLYAVPFANDSTSTVLTGIDSVPTTENVTYAIPMAETTA